LEPTYNPALLSRASNLASDIAFFLQCPESTWQSHPAHTSLLLSRPQAFVEYVTHLQALSDSADPSLLLAHTYVRYLGDLSGGRVIRHRVAKAYGIDMASGEGVKFYDFKSLDATKPHKMDDFKKIKEWFRAGMNSGIGENKKLKGKQAG
jgi:heme oxygenase